MHSLIPCSAQIDSNNLGLKPEAQQVLIANLNALKPWLYD